MSSSKQKKNAKEIPSLPGEPMSDSEDPDKDSRKAEAVASNPSEITPPAAYYTSHSRHKERRNRPSHIQQLLYQVLEKMSDEIKQDKNMARLQSEVIDPLIQYSFRRMYPYIMMTTVIVLLLLITVIASLTLIIRLNFSK